MGWTYQRRTHKTIKDFFEQYFGEGKKGIKITVLDAAQIHFSEAYAAIEFVRENKEREVFCATFLINYSRNNYHNFGYKDMTEHSGPVVHQCPERIMRLLTPIQKPNEKDSSNQWARNWRARNWKIIRNRNRMNRIKRKFKIGDIIFLKAPLRFANGNIFEELTIASTKPLRFHGRVKGMDNTYSLLSVRKNVLNEVFKSVISIN